MLRAAVKGDLTKQWREEHNIHFETWKELTIGEIAKVQTGKTPKRSIAKFWENGNIPWLTSSATNNTFTRHADQFVTQAAVDEGLKLFEPGTLLLAMYGEGKTRGQVTEITFEATCNQACAAIIVDKSQAMREFVRLRLNESYEQTRKAASGGNQSNLNLSKVRSIPLPLPSLEEQAEIVLKVNCKFDEIQRLDSELDIQLVKAEKIKQSILASAFSGQLVSSLASDETVEELLKRIDEQRKLVVAQEKNEKKKLPRRIKEIKLEKKSIIEILKSTVEPISPEVLFDRTGRDSGTIDEAEEFYIELKKSLSDQNLVVEPITEEGIKQKDLLSYKVKNET